MPSGDRGQERLRRARAEAARIRAEARTPRRLTEPGRRPWRSAGMMVGERVVGGTLAAELAALEAAGWLLLHDVRRRFSRLATLDHVAVGPTGVVAVQQLPWSGAVAVEGDVLRLNGASYAYETRRFAAAVTALGAVLEAGTSARGVLCLLPAQPAPAVVAPGVHVVGRAGLAAVLSAGPVVLAAPAVAEVHGRLAEGLRCGDGLRTPRLPPPGA